MPKQLRSPFLDLIEFVEEFIFLNETCAVIAAAPTKAAPEVVKANGFITLEALTGFVGLRDTDVFESPSAGALRSHRSKS